MRSFRLGGRSSEPAFRGRRARPTAALSSVPAWVAAEIIGGMTPGVMVDFVNGKTWNGVSEGSAPADFVGGSPTITAGTGLLLNKIGIVAAGALLAACKLSEHTVVLEVAGGTAGIFSGVLSYDGDAVLLQADTDIISSYRAAGGSTLSTTAKIRPAKRAIYAGRFNSAGRMICANGQLPPVSDAIAYAVPSTVTLGSWAGGTIHGGALRAIRVYPGSLSAADVRRASLGAPRFGNALAFRGNSYVTVPGFPAWNRVPPRSWLAAMTCYNLPATTDVEGMLLFGDCGANLPFSGWEAYVHKTGVLKFRVIRDFGASQFLSVAGTTDIADGKPHIVGGSFDGVGTSAGVKLFVDGVQEAVTVETDLLLNGTGSSASPYPMMIGNQDGVAIDRYFLPGTLDFLSISSSVRDAAWFAANAAAVPAVDANTALHYNFNEGSGTSTFDSSGNGRTGTVTSPDLWAR